MCELQGVTLTRYMMEVSRANPHLSEVESLMNSIQTACKVGAWVGGCRGASCCFVQEVDGWMDGWMEVRHAHPLFKRRINWMVA